MSGYVAYCSMHIPNYDRLREWYIVADSSVIREVGVRSRVAEGLAEAGGSTWQVWCLYMSAIELTTRNLPRRNMLSILRKARLKDKEMRILMLCVLVKMPSQRPANP